MTSRTWRAAVAVGSTLAVAATAHTAWNLRALRRPPSDPPPVRERVSVLLPVRNERARVRACLEALLVQENVDDLEIIVLDDGSTDGTAGVVRLVAGDDPRVQLVNGGMLPNDWLGKPFACQQLADRATGRVLVFVDADVVLAPTAIAATVTALRWSALDLVSPYPRQIAHSPGERLVQPLLQWSWLTTLPLGLAESSPRESLVAANGQLLAVDAEVYERAGGHAAVRNAVLDDIALLRAVKRSGGRGVVVDGTELAACHMYEGWDELRAGYTKSLWSAFGSPQGAAVTCGVLGLVYVAPAVAALRGSRTGAVGYAAGVAGRAMVARRVGGRVWPDSLAHPASVALLTYLTAESWRGRRAGTLRWKDRVLP